MTQSVMDRLLTAGLCGNTLGQDIQTLTYHSSTSNMAFHLKDVWFKVGSLLFVTYTIIQGIISSEMYVVATLHGRSI